jgi:hypothetical protein
MSKALSPNERKIPFNVALSPRQSSYAMSEARRLQISAADVIRRLLDREIDKIEMRPQLTQRDFRA